MPKFYDNIPGWFHASDLFDMVANKFFPQQSLFVEIGSYFGRSSCYMIELITEKKSDVKFDVIDPWVWDRFFEDVHKRTEHERVYRSDKLRDEHRRVVEMIGKDPYKIIEHYLTTFNILNNRVNLIKNKSSEAVKRYQDKSIDFLYIDGDHSFNVVKSDITLYLPKIKIGGIISGDDYDAVKPIVDEVLGNVALMNSKTWWKEISK